MLAKDMTKGSPTRLLLGFSLPMLLGNIFQQFYSMVDSIVVGKGIGVNAFAAVGSTGWVSFLILGFATGLTSGFGIEAAQRFGAGDAKGLRHTLTQGTFLSLVISIVFTAIALPTSLPLLRLLNTPENIIGDANIYLLIVYAGIPATVFYNFYASILRSLGNSRGPLYVLILSSLLNVGLDLLFVLVFRMGVAGAGVATVISQILAAVLCFLILRKYPVLKTEKADWPLKAPVLKRLFLLGVPMALQNSVIAIGGIILQAIVNGFGSTYVAGFTAANKVMGIAEQPSIAFGMAIATYSGQNLGAGKIDRIRLGMRRSLVISILANLFVGAILVFFNRPIVSLFVDASETAVLDAAGLFLIVMGICSWILGYLYVYRSALQGMGNTVIPMLSGIIELVMRVVVALTVPVLLGLGFFGICLAEVSAWAGAEILLMTSYYIVMHRKKKEAPAA